jgi:Sec-independent protein secretion pathway component TatC
MTMNTNDRTAKFDVRSKLSTLWILVMFNMIFADVIGFMNPGALEEIMKGETGFEITQGLLVVFAVLVEIPIAMVLLSRVLNRRANQLANSAAVVLTTLFVIGGRSEHLSYLFFATIEVLSMLLILWFAWSWPKQEA